MLKVFCSCEDQLRPICIIKVPCTISLNNMQKDWDVFLYSAMYIEQKQLRRHRFLPLYAAFVVHSNNNAYFCTENVYLFP